VTSSTSNDSSTPDFGAATTLRVQEKLAGGVTPGVAFGVARGEAPGKAFPHASTVTFSSSTNALGVGFPSREDDGFVQPVQTSEGGKQQRNRRIRMERQHFLWEKSSLKSVRFCGKTPIASAVSLKLKTASDGSNRASFGGLIQCGSGACAKCSFDNSVKSASKISRVIKAFDHRTNGQGEYLFVTLTMRNKPSDGKDLSLIWKNLSAAYSSLASGRVFAREKKRFRIAGTVRAVELLATPVEDFKLVKNHLHTHLLLLINPDKSGKNLSDEEIDEFRKSFISRWIRLLSKRFNSSPELPAAVFQAQDVRRVSSEVAAGLSGYFTKEQSGTTKQGSLALELSFLENKKGKFGSLTPFQVLDHARTSGSAGALRWWRRFEAHQRSKKRILYSREIKDLLDEYEDSEIEDSESSDDAETSAEERTIAVFDVSSWKLLRSQPKRLIFLLETIENFGAEAGFGLLRGWKIPYVLPPDVPPEPFS